MISPLPSVNFSVAIKIISITYHIPNPPAVKSISKPVPTLPFINLWTPNIPKAIENNKDNNQFIDKEFC